MPKALPEVAKDAMELPVRHRLALAELSLVSADESGDEDAADAEIRARIEVVEAGKVTGIPYEDVMRKADRLLNR